MFYPDFLCPFLIEFIKEDQEAFEAAMALNMGQWLSIPSSCGIFLVVRALKLPEKVYKNPVESAGKQRFFLIENS